uniref:Uncharacterized protein n=1 Tax=Astyanax mexicanus TaxID=7994 RepID=A0A3B1IK73_ASTMX
MKNRPGEANGQKDQGAGQEAREREGERARESERGWGGVSAVFRSGWRQGEGGREGGLWRLFHADSTRERVGYTHTYTLSDTYMRERGGRKRATSSPSS